MGTARENIISQLPSLLFMHAVLRHSAVYSRLVHVLYENYIEYLDMETRCCFVWYSFWVVSRRKKLWLEGLKSCLQYVAAAAEAAAVAPAGFYRPRSAYPSYLSYKHKATRKMRWWCSWALRVRHFTENIPEVETVRNVVCLRDVSGVLPLN